jgi:signal transduction histidine kinase
MPTKLTLVLLLTFNYLQLPAQSHVDIDDSAEIVFLGKSAVFFEDKNRDFTLEEVKQDSFAHNFRPFPTEILNLSTTSSAVWLKLNLHIHTTKRYYIQIDNPDIDSAFFYFPTSKNDYHYTLTGKNFPISAETIASTHCIIEIPQTLTTQPQHYYLRLTSRRYIIVDIKAVSQNTILNTLLMRYMIELIFFGVVFLAVLYNLFVFISIRDISYLYYVIYTALIGLNIANGRGYLGLFFPYWREFFSGQYSFLLGALYIPFITLFAISFLKVKQYNVWIYRGLLLLLFISFVHIFLSIFGLGGILFKALHTFLFLNLAIYMTAGFVVYRKGYKPALYFLASWSIFTICTIIAILAYTNFIPYTWFSKYFTPLGTMSETIISAIGLASQISMLKKEKKAIYQEHITFIEQQKEVLEQKVTERTNELHTKTKKIENQNAALKQYQQELILINELLHQRNDLIEQQHEEINELNKDLEKRIADRTNELQSALDNLTKQNQDLEQFSYIISHNIRAPIARIQGLLNIFNQENFNDEANKEIFKYLEYATFSLDMVIKDLTLIITIRKDLNKVKEKIDIVELINSELFFLANEITASNALINTQIEIDTIFSIKSYIQNIIHNLISNAIKYRDTKRQLKIEITVKQKTNYAVLTVQDNGLGIDVAKTDLYKIFGLYQRMHTHVEGKGLGLYLVKTQVDALQGKISVDSKLNEGATFKVYFPIE